MKLLNNSRSKLVEFTNKLSYILSARAYTPDTYISTQLFSVRAKMHVNWIFKDHVMGGAGVIFLSAYEEATIVHTDDRTEIVSNIH